MTIELSNIKFSFEGTKRVLNDISFSVEKGKALSIVGASGCGKSTLLRIISGLLPCTNSNQLHGTIKIENLSPDEYRRKGKLSFMFQDATLLPHLSVKQNIELPLKIKGFTDHQKVSELLKAVGLEDYADYLPKHLSGGMKTRVALARSFVTEPELLLLDEPFSALDIAWKSKLYVELEKLREQYNTTVVLVTHDVQEALLLADKILILGKKGIVIGEENINEGYSIMSRLTNIAQFNNSAVFQTLYSSIQKWIMDDAIREITGTKEIDAIFNRIQTAAGSEQQEYWQTIDTDIISIREHSGNSAANEILYEAFTKAKTFNFKYQLVWDILEYQEIDSSKLNNIVKFYIDNIKKTSQQSVAYYNVAPEKLFEHLVNTRIQSNRFLESKRWIYLCDMYASSETEKVLDYLLKVETGQIQNLNFDLAKQIAKTIKEKIKHEKLGSVHIA